LKNDATIEASLQEPSLPDQSSIRFNANASVAEEVAYAAPAVCSQLKDAKTVKDAIDGLCRQVSFSCVGGDGQEAMPGYELPGPLRVRVARGSYPVVGAIVKFKIEKEKGLLSARSGETGRDELNVSTDENGIASCFCSLKKDAKIEASLQEPSLPDQSSIRFNAKLSLAEDVAYAAPIACSQLEDVKTVRDALNKLCLRAATPLTTWVHGNSLHLQKIEESAVGDISLRYDDLQVAVVSGKTGSKAKIFFSIPVTYNFENPIRSQVLEAFLRAKINGKISISEIFINDGESVILNLKAPAILIKEDWNTILLSSIGKDISWGIGITLVVDFTTSGDKASEILFSAAGCKIKPNI
jgi:hypothetical protein